MIAPISALASSGRPMPRLYNSSTSVLLDFLANNFASAFKGLVLFFALASLAFLVSIARFLF